MKSDCFFSPLDANARVDPIEIAAPCSSHLAKLVTAANGSARGFAYRRLAEQIASPAIDALSRYFEHPAVYESRSSPQSHGERWTTWQLVKTICARPQTLAFGEKARGMQIGISGPQLAREPGQLGMQVEPNSDVFFLDPAAILATAMENASVEIRLFDRHNSDWANMAEDIIAVSGADVFFKLFIAGGERSINGWHRDASDVLVMLLDGTKKFEVATTESSDDRPSITLSTVMKPGDILLLPRGRLHKATPTGEVSSLLSIGLMRCGDWFYRGASPTHLRLRNPRSPHLYRLMLHPRTRPTWALRDAEGQDVYRSRIPGGIGLIASDGAVFRFLACGTLWGTDIECFEILARIHGEDGVTRSGLSQMTGRDQGWCEAVAEAAVECGLARRTTRVPNRSRE